MDDDRQDDNDETLPDGVYTGRAGGFHTYRAGQTEADEQSASFVLAGSKEVRHGPWQTGGDMLAVGEFKLQNFRRNPVVLMEHDARHVIGRGTAKVEGEQLTGTVVWDTDPSNPLGILAASQHARKFRSAVSVGFMPGKGTVPRTRLPSDHAAHIDPKDTPDWRAGSYIRNPELYEFSSVSVPKDPTALQLRSWALEAEGVDDRIRRILGELLPRAAQDAVLRAWNNDSAIRSAIVASVLAEVPTQPTQPPPAPPADWWENWQ